MTHITFDALSHGRDLGLVTGWLPDFIDRLDARYRRWRTYRTVKAELEQYEPEELADFGVTEADIDQVAREAAPSLTNR